MASRFISNLSFLVLLNLLIKPFWILGVDRSVQNTVGPEEYGFYYALFNFVLLFQFALDMGINGWNNRSVARDPETLRNRFSRILVFKLFLVLFFAVLVILVGSFLGFSRAQFSLLIWLGVNQILLSFLLFVRSNISGLQHFRWDAIISVLDRVFMILFCGLLLWTNLFPIEFSVSWFVYAQTAGYATALLIALSVLLIKEPTIKFGFARLGLFNILRESFPYALLGILMLIYFRVDAVMLERMLVDGSYEAGKYASSFRLLDALIMFAFLFSTILLPLFSKMIKEGQNLKGILSLSIRTLGCFSLLASLVCIFFNEELMQLLYSHTQDSWSRMFAWLLVALPIISWIYVLGTLLTAHGKLRALNLISLLALVLNVCLNLWLIPEYKALGATWATLGTQGLVLLLHLLYVARVFPISEIAPDFFRTLVFGILSALGILAIRSSGMEWQFSLLLSCLFSTALAFGMGLFKLKSLKGLLRGSVS